MSLPRAVIFTHCNYLKGIPCDRAFIQQNRDRYTDFYAARFKSYLSCNRGGEILITHVYAYLDFGMRRILPSLRGNAFTLDPEVVALELALKNILKHAEKRARQSIGVSSSRLPHFTYLGLIELVDLLENLIDSDPDLITFLTGPGGVFTYDSPKFVEAVVRLGRGDIPALARYPIIRVDDDAIVNPHAIRQLLERFAEISLEPFYFFSGRYGREDGLYDPVNDYAVRTHWFFPAGTVSGDHRFPEHPEYQERARRCETFLADLTVLGARQIVNNDAQFSGGLQQLINGGSLRCDSRSSTEVISGAGLLMGRRNVEMLPPFMNFGRLITWVDDHLKRLLHERIGDMQCNYLESVVNATFQQHRYEHDVGITPEDIAKASDYFERLIAGCMLHAIIDDQDGAANDPSYADLIQDIVFYRKDSRSLDLGARNIMAARLKRIAVQHYENVLKCWSSDVFTGYASWEWARSQLDLAGLDGCTPRLCTAVVSDAMNYIDLLLHWPKFTRAIERILPIGNAWLFEDVG